MLIEQLVHELSMTYTRLFDRNSKCSLRDLKNTVPELRLPMITSLSRQKRFSYRGAKLWNALAREVNQSPSLSVFKEKLLLNGKFN